MSLFRFGSSLLRLGEQRIAAAGASFATQANDYSLAMKTAAEVGKPSQSVPEKEASWAVSPLTSPVSIAQCPTSRCRAASGQPDLFDGSPPPGGSLFVVL